MVLTRSTNGAYKVISSQNDGTITGATYVAGEVGSNALSFDGNDSISLGAPSDLDMRTKATISFRMKLDTLAPTDDFPRIYDSASGGGTRKGISVLLQKSSSRLKFEIWNNGSQVNIDLRTTKDDWTLGQWYNIVLVWDSSLATKNVQWYIDGTAENSDNETGVPDGITNDVTLGNLWEGDLDEVRIYDKALSSAEVTILFNKGNVSNSLVARYAFEEGSGSIAFDTSVYDIAENHSLSKNNSQIVMGYKGSTTVPILINKGSPGTPY